MHEHGTDDYKYEFAEQFVGPSPKCPIKAIATFRSPVDPDLFLVSARYGKYGESACGCGYNLREARVKAIMEGIERKTTSSPLDAPGGVVTAAPWSLEQAYLDPGFYIPLDKERAKAAGLRPYSEKRKLRWVHGVSYDMSQPSPLIPVDMVYYDFRSNDRLYYANSSGVAAHANRARAFENAVTELVERDALMRFWISGRSHNINEYATASDIVATRMDYWETHGRRLDFYSLPSKYGDVVLATITGDTWPAFICGAAARLRCLEVTTRPRSELDLLERALFEAEGNYVAYDNCCHTSLHPERVQSPFEHGLFYCDSEHFQEIKALLFDGRPTLKEPFPYECQIIHLQSIYNSLDLSYFWTTELPASFGKLVHVVRVFSGRLIPISFSLHLFHRRHAEVRKLSLELGVNPGEFDTADIFRHVRLFPHFFP